MFEKYTEKARRIIFFARYEASNFGSPYIETEHLLLGVAREDKPWILRISLKAEAVRKEVESRIQVRRAELVAQLRELRADRRLEAGEAGDKLKARLSELSHLLKWGVVDGWASLGDKVKHRLEHWLAESRSQLPAQGGSARTGQS